MVPGSRLLWWVGLVVVPCSAVAGAVPDLMPVALGLVGALAGLVLLDAALGYGSLGDVGLHLPEVVRLTKDREGTIEVAVRNPRRRARRIRLGLALPPEIRSTEDSLCVLLPAGTEWCRFDWACTALKRGAYRIDRCYLEEPSPLGFWAMRGTAPTGVELRVYPNLLPERKYLAALFLNRGSLGTHAQRQVGKGREFEMLRAYIPGDGYDDIHWKATAKQGRPVTKVFQIERTQEVYVIIDASRLSARSPATSGETVADSPEASGMLPGFAPTILERFVTAALVMCLAAERQGDHFGLLTFSDRIVNFVRATGGQAHYRTCRDALYALQPQIATPAFDEVCSFVRLRVRHRALLVFLTSLDDPVLAESFVRAVSLLSRHHLVLVNMLAPPGARPLFSEQGAKTIEDVYRHLSGHIQWHALQELERVLHRRGVGFSLLDNEKLCLQLVSQYIGIKQRQLL